MLVFLALLTSAAKEKAKKREACVSGYCLKPDYNRLELPRQVTHIDMNLEVH